MTDTTPESANPVTGRPAATADGLVNFKPDGTIVVPIDGRDYRLGLGKIGVIRELRLALDRVDQGVQDDGADASPGLVDAQQRILVLSEDAATLAELTDEERTKAASVSLEDRLAEMKDLRHQAIATRQKLEEQGAGARLDWITEVFDALCPDPPEPENYPAWVVSATFARKLLRHWQTIPLGSGDPSAKVPQE